METEITIGAGMVADASSYSFVVAFIFWSHLYCYIPQHE